MTTNRIPVSIIPTGHLNPDIDMVVLVRGKRYQIIGFNRTTLNVLGEDGKTYKLSMGRTGTVQPDIDQSWAVSATALPTFGLGQVVRFADAKGAAKYPGHYVVIKTTDQTVSVVPLGGDPAHPDRYVRASPGLLVAVTGTFQVD